MNDILERVLNIQNSINTQERNDFINDYIPPFIVKNVSKTTGRYVNSLDSDEYSIGLMAFDEAIDKYNADKGSFVGFASLMIRNRVIDFMRKEWHYNQDVDLDEQVLLNESTRVDEDLTLEIRSFKERLMEFGITMEDLADKGPKHKKTRQWACDLGRDISMDPPISEKLYRTKKLPMAEVCLKYKATKKQLKTHRDFIIGVVIIFKDQLIKMTAYINIRGESNE